MDENNTFNNGDIATKSKKVTYEDAITGWLFNNIL